MLHNMSLLGIILCSVHVFKWPYIFSCLRYIPKGGIAESEIMLKFLKNCQFPKTAALFYISTSSITILISLQLCQHLLLSVYLVTAIPVDVR